MESLRPEGRACRTHSPSREEEGGGSASITAAKQPDSTAGTGESTLLRSRRVRISRSLPPPRDALLGCFFASRVVHAANTSEGKTAAAKEGDKAQTWF